MAVFSMRNATPYYEEEDEESVLSQNVSSVHSKIYIYTTASYLFRFFLKHKLWGISKQRRKGTSVLRSVKS